MILILKEWWKKLPAKTINLKEFGFSLLETLIGLTLMTVILTVVIGQFGSGEDDGNEALFQLERAVRFASQESLVRRKVTRLVLLPDENAFQIEIARTDDFILSVEDTQQDFSDSFGLDSEEKKKKRQDEITKQFDVLDEFSDKPFELPKRIKLHGMVKESSLSLKNPLLTESSALYFYPSGEREAGLIIIYSQMQLLSLSIAPFTEVLKRSYDNFSQEGNNSESSIQLQVENISEKLIREWISQLQSNQP